MPHYSRGKSDSCHFEVLVESHRGLQGEITDGLRQKELVRFPTGRACRKWSVFPGHFQGTITLPASSPVAVRAAAGGRILLYVSRKPEWELLSESVTYGLVTWETRCCCSWLLSKKGEGMCNCLQWELIAKFVTFSLTCQLLADLQRK